MTKQPPLTDEEIADFREMVELKRRWRWLWSLFFATAKWLAALVAAWVALRTIGEDAKIALKLWLGK